MLPGEEVRSHRAGKGLSARWPSHCRLSVSKPQADQNILKQTLAYHDCLESGAIEAKNSHI